MRLTLVNSLTDLLFNNIGMGFNCIKVYLDLNTKGQRYNIRANNFFNAKKLFKNKLIDKYVMLQIEFKD